MRPGSLWSLPQFWPPHCIFITTTGAIGDHASLLPSPPIRSRPSCCGARRSLRKRRTTQLANRHGPRADAVSSPIGRHRARRPHRPPHRNLRTGRRHGRHRRHRQFPGHLHPVHRLRLWPGAGGRALARRRPHRHRHHIGRSVLGNGAGRGRARAADQEDPLYRPVRLHHRQLQQPRSDHLQLIRRPWHRGGRRHDERRPASSARQDRRSRHRRRQAHPDRHFRDDGLHQRLRRISSKSSFSWSPG